MLNRSVLSLYSQTGLKAFGSVSEVDSFNVYAALIARRLDAPLNLVSFREWPSNYSLARSARFHPLTFDAFALQLA